MFPQIRISPKDRDAQRFLHFSDIQLHVLTDGGEQAYACVAYRRITYDDGTVSVALIGSKARVAPLKPLSIPRLELQAALIATRFAHTVKNAHRLKSPRQPFSGQTPLPS